MKHPCWDSTLGPSICGTIISWHDRNKSLNYIHVFAQARMVTQGGGGPGTLYKECFLKGISQSHWGKKNCFKITFIPIIGHSAYLTKLRKKNGADTIEWLAKTCIWTTLISGCVKMNSPCDGSIVTPINILICMEMICSNGVDKSSLGLDTFGIMNNYFKISTIESSIISGFWQPKCQIHYFFGPCVPLASWV